MPSHVLVTEAGRNDMDLLNNCFLLAWLVFREHIDY